MLLWLSFGALMLQFRPHFRDCSGTDFGQLVNGCTLLVNGNLRITDNVDAPAMADLQVIRF